MKVAKFLACIAAVSPSLLGGQPAENTPITIANSLPDFSTLAPIECPGVPEWAQNAVFYQIYPQSFCDSDGDGIGDLKGIISKLDYVKSLGVDAIWLNPFYESPFRDAGYDITDYCKVAPRYGTNDDARALFKAAHEKGLRVIIDFVPGHTSIDHPWFKSSCSPTPNKYSNWYIWTNSTWFPGDEKYREKFIQGYCDRDGNYMVNFFWHQPALNYGWGVPDPNQPWQLPTDNPDVTALQTEMKSILRFWLEMGCDGFRCDMAGSLVKNDPDKKIALFWQDIRRMLDDRYPYAFLVSEWGDPKTAVESGFHSDFIHWVPGFFSLWGSEQGFFHDSGQGDIVKFLSTFEACYKATKGKGFVSIPSDNHDMARVRRFGRDKADLELIYVFLMTMPDIPFLYYGDEIGMRDQPGLGSKEGSYGRSSCRTPMQWNHGINLGFSTAPADKLYLPVDSEADAPTVASEETDPDSLLHFIRTLVKFRREHPALTPTAAFVPIYAMPRKYPFIFARSDGEETLLVTINPSNEIQSAEIDGELNRPISLSLGSGTVFTSLNGKTWITTRGKSFSIYLLEKQK